MESSTAVTIPMQRRLTRKLQLGSVELGGDAPISVQSMTNTLTEDVASTVAQIQKLGEAGCEIVRVAVPHMESARAISEIRKQTDLPLVADIHFDHRLALAAADAGCDGLRINPGNIGSEIHVREVVAAAKDKGLPIRIGVNGGSLEKDLMARYGGATPHAMVESALGHVAILEKQGFGDIKISLKASDVPRTVAAYRLLSKRCDYPLHVGVTEAGGLFPGVVKSALGIGMLLSEGIGDTLRVSLTRDPVEEVRVGFEILKSLGLRQRGPDIISCPTCGRTRIDLFSILDAVEKRLMGVMAPIKVAIMGCVVNGPGEAREADVGIAGGMGKGILFRKGEVVRKCREDELVDVLMAEVAVLEEEWRKTVKTG
ncbi:flavodoxin-dependent (E)-4-hydroxy-3-methylbut-2-enyl-diphosphate synthase [Desulfobotulus mexicanus]|uniref:4-hydroxy-3-methylbut-2-en-1-yl diphosphate synthase (flavodoxin) n=1 Tax=Desulfobotulus mexicanus TaxID=2586642 RepID=A0A5S5MDM4_9BACT|nr:flavodoxin-dependent (E)-4-hydroxy-3-methylbut-2-enyl-diphosphate synthase [Desulfobotulus mexicanus]TYT73779.1 flavodoxin-dependent (E)-4-hydroxy-3-methylbut-2-enyl-diphosphate synthase [Desulfobotulus mexicanus]